MSDRKVRPGDCFARIAQANNFFNYRTLYDHGDNATLKGQRPNPNQLVEGDVVKIPQKQQKTVNAVLDGTKSFVVDRKKTKLRLVLTDCNKKALVPSSCLFTVGAASSAKVPGAQGLLELEVDPEEVTGRLKMTFAGLPAAGAPPPDPAAPNPPGNPPIILPSEFRDRALKPQTDAFEATWDLYIGYLEPKESIRGSLQRLNNLTYPTPVRQDENDKTRPFVKGYQVLRKSASKTGNVSDIRDDLATFHDTP